MMMKQTDTLKILVVDDEDIVRLTFFVDMRMPGLDGMNLLKWSRQKRLGLPIIIMSGHGAEDSRDEALQSGAFAFLSKPFSLVGIKGLIEKIQDNFNAVTASTH
jgi:DNA-binding NtrC family response regulator